MKLTLTFDRLNGDVVALTAWFALDGAIQFWQANNPTTGAHVELSSADKWHAISRLNRAVMARGAG